MSWNACLTICAVSLNLEHVSVNTSDMAVTRSNGMAQPSEFLIASCKRADGDRAQH